MNWMAVIVPANMIQRLKSQKDMMFLLNSRWGC